MPWFRVDDGLMQHAKVLAIPRRDRLACIGLWTAAGTWSARNLQDGKVPTHVVEELGGSERLAGVLVDAGLWKKARNGFQFRNWKEFQPTRADVLADREAAKERMRSARERKRAEAEARNAAGQDHDRSGEHSRTSDEQFPRSENVRQPRPDPTRPDPTPSFRGSVSESPHQGAGPVDNGAEKMPAPAQPLRGGRGKAKRVCIRHRDEELNSQGVCVICHTAELTGETA